MEELEKKLGYTFRDPELLRAALYHSSYANEHRSEGIRSNERLEFLGDAVLGFVSAEHLFKKHPELPEGDLTRIRAALVCEESLHEVAQSLDLGSHLLLGKGEEQGGGRHGVRFCRRVSGRRDGRRQRPHPPRPAGQGTRGGGGGAPPGL